MSENHPLPSTQRNALTTTPPRRTSILDHGRHMRLPARLVLDISMIDRHTAVLVDHAALTEQIVVARRGQTVNADTCRI